MLLNLLKANRRIAPFTLSKDVYIHPCLIEMEGGRCHIHVMGRLMVYNRHPTEASSHLFVFHWNSDIQTRPPTDKSMTPPCDDSAATMLDISVQFDQIKSSETCKPYFTDFIFSPIFHTNWAPKSEGQKEFVSDHRWSIKRRIIHLALLFLGESLRYSELVNNFLFK